MRGFDQAGDPGFTHLQVSKHLEGCGLDRGGLQFYQRQRSPLFCGVPGCVLSAEAYVPHPSTNAPLFYLCRVHAQVPLVQGQVGSGPAYMYVPMVGNINCTTHRLGGAAAFEITPDGTHGHPVGFSCAKCLGIGGK